MKQGAEIAVKKCMKLHSEDTVLIVADEPSKEIGMTLRAVALEITDKVRFFNLDLPAYGGRPIQSMPPTLQEAIGQATASFYVAQAFEGELQTLRVPYLKLVVQNARHAHMVGVTKQIMETGMCADYDVIERVTNTLFNLMSTASEVHVTSPAGTDFTAELDPAYRWKRSGGIIKNLREWENLPSGELYTNPRKLNGTLIVDGVVGEWIGAKHSGRMDFRETPLEIEVEETPEGSFIKELKCKDGKLYADFDKYVHEDPCASRVGELGLGTNIFLEEIIGNILQDEKFPTVHVAFGDPYAEHTGATWSCDHHIDVLMRKCDIEVDGTLIMKEGKYTKDITG